MSARQQGHQQALQHVILPDDHPFDFKQQVLHQRGGWALVMLGLYHVENFIGIHSFLLFRTIMVWRC